MKSCSCGRRLQALIFGLVFLSFCWFLPTQTASAQNVYAAIHGTVSDPTGAVIPNANVTVLNTSTGISSQQTTDSKGYYIFPQLAIGGPYSITISVSGFQTFKVAGLTLQLNDNREVNAVLRPGEVSQSVEVNAAAVQVETSDSQVKDTITGSQIVQLPLLGRDATVLQKISPGTVESSDRFGNYSANGSQTQENSYLLDGADVNDAPLQTQALIINPDAIQEVTFVTGTQNPEYNRNSGAIINQTIKSGTNSFHGDAFEFYRDTFLNNGNYFSTSRPVFHQNLFGGTLGGPVLRNRLFFFLAYQGLRNATAATTVTSVPTDAQLGRNSSGYADLTNDNNVANNGTNGTVGLTSNPLPFALQGPNGTCLAGTPWNSCFSGPAIHVPVTNFNSISSTLLNKYVPSPNYNGAFYNFNAASTAGADQGVVRVDAKLTDNDALWASSIFQSNPSVNALPFTGATLPGFAQDAARHIKIFSASWTHTFNPTTLNELRAGYYRFNFAAVEPVAVQPPSSLGFQINPQNPAAASIPKISVTGYFTLGFSNNGPQPRLDANEDYADNFTKIVGNHNLMFGAHVERFTVHNPFYANLNGNYGFSGSGAFTSGDPLLDFLVGIPSSYAQGSGAEIDARSWEIYGYAQDNWKINSSFTLNFGTGYDIETPFANLQYGGKAVICFTPGAQSKVFPTAQPSLLYPGDPGCNNMGGATTKYDHFSPRVGFVWSPSGEAGWLTGPSGAHKFSVRGGFGLYFNRDSEEAQLQNLEDPPFGTTSTGATDVGGSPSFANPFQDVAGRAGMSEPNKFPYSFPTAGQTINFSQFVPYDLSTISPSYDVPYAYNMMLQIQRELPGNQVLTVGYIGSLGRHLVRAYEADQITPSGHAAAVAACNAMGESSCLSNLAAHLSLTAPQWFTETSGNFLSVGQVRTDGSSNYHSLQASLNKQLSHGLYYILSYTYSHALDNGSSFESSGFANGNDLAGTNWVPGFQYLSYGNSEYDARHRFVAAYGYTVPLPQSWKENYFVNEILGGWNLSGITTLQTGNPVSIGDIGLNSSLYCNDASFAFYACPDTPVTSTFHIAVKNPRSAGNYWFDPSVFSPEPLGTFGNVKRNFFHGPGFNYTNMALFKDFPLGRADSPRYIQLRLESFNVFNHANFAGPDGNLTDGPLFGKITSVITPVADGGAGDPQPGRAVQLAAKIYF
ncbi:carboxypeptidase regulatory-like domain-containing protein [Pseudacidobacterium ailaaui]|uniref:carboxypeptidase regulatory-like domain-containing protein n=1 Tax=Pseudacidobacterium ailaaui TaxID=1382359 RepID=UPI0006794684|nr:carboxypeptidase-like regulatory domain-containing protein [Pseudacidobacterium ailaaui]